MGTRNFPILTAGSSRVWITEDGAHPDHPPVLQSIHKLDDPSQSYGDETRIEVPSISRFDGFDSVGSIQGEVERASFGISGRYAVRLSDLLRLARRRCIVDAYVLEGECNDPQDFTQGWEKILFFPDGKISTWALENAGALESGEQNPQNEAVEMSADDMYEFGMMGISRLAETEASSEITTIAVCDDENCGDCGQTTSDGCQRVLATMIGVGATPGTLPQLLYSEDSGVTWSTQDISTLFANEQADDKACIGPNYAIVSNASGTLHYTNLDDLYLGTNTWFEVTSGFVAAGAPNSIWSTDIRNTWIVGSAGYIYYTQNITLGVNVQDAGVATTQNLLAVHALNEDNVLATGELNAVVVSRNGGVNWEAVTGPAVGIALKTCWMWSENVWFIGDAVGGLWYTVNGGVSWKSKVTNSEVDNIDKIVFVNKKEGYLTVRLGSGAARIMKTITGGYEWYILPDGSISATPGADYFTDAAICGTGRNLVFAAGLDDDGTTGIIVKASA